MTAGPAGINTKCLKKGDPEPPPPAQGVVRLYNMRFAPFPERVVLALALKGIRSEVININLKEKPEWYFKKHPEGKVPSLEFNREVIIESGLILEYLENRFPETKRLFTGDAFANYQQKLVIEQLMASVVSAVIGLLEAIKNPSLTNREEKIAAAKEALQKAEGLLKDEYFGGSSPGFSDVLLLPFFERIHWVTILIGGPFDGASFPGKDYPKLTNYYAKILNHPAIKNVVLPASVGIGFFDALIKGTEPNPDHGL